MPYLTTPERPVLALSRLAAATSTAHFLTQPLLRRTSSPAALQECHCMLFLTPEDDFRGEEQKISLDQLVEMTKDM